MKPCSLNTQFSITAAINRLAILIDAGRYEEASEIFALDATMQRPSEKIETREAILASFLARPIGRFTRHFIASCLVEPDRHNGAKSTTYVMVYRNHSSTAERPMLPLAYRDPEAIAEYHDVWVCKDDQWLISSRVVQPVFEPA